MKKAFTLVELLVVLAILGVIVALTLSATVFLRPDETKVGYLKVYDTISASIKELSSNSIIFPTCQDNVSCQKYPLINTAGRVTRMGCVIPAGNTKLCRLLGEELTTYSEATISTACNQMEGYTYTDANFYERAMHNRTGQDFIISTYMNKGSQIEYQTDIYFDVNGQRGNNCIYNETTCQ